MSDYDDATEVTEQTDIDGEGEGDGEGDDEDIISEADGVDDNADTDVDADADGDDETVHDGDDSVADEDESVDDEDEMEDDETDDKQEHTIAPVTLARPLTNTSYIGCTVAQSEEVIVITGVERSTSDIASVYEFTEAISLRTEQISTGGLNACMLRADEIPKSATNARDIAIAEIQMRRCPLKVMRQVGAIPDASGKIKKYVEVWSMNELMFPLFQ